MSFDRVGDISLGDFSKIKCPEKDFIKGSSMVLVNTLKGETLLKNIAELFDIEEEDKDKALESMSYSLQGKRRKPEKYNRYIDDIGKMVWADYYNKHLLPTGKDRIVEMCPYSIMAFIRKIRRIMKLYVK